MLRDFQLALFFRYAVMPVARKAWTAVARSYHSLHSQDRRSEEKLASFLQKNGQQLLPMIDLIEQSRVAVEELIDTVGRVMLETVLVVSAEQVAGVRQPGKARISRSFPRWWKRLGSPSPA